MNNLQKQLLDFAVAQYKVDSTPGIPLCCDDHKIRGWIQVHLLSGEILHDPEAGKIIKENLCLN